MSRALSVVMAVMLMMAPPDQGSKAVRTDLALMEGEFYLVSCEINGQAMAEEVVKSARRVTRDGIVTVMFAGQPAMRARLILDPSKSPREVDYEMLDGPSKGRKQLGIYEITEDANQIDLRFCIAGPDYDRPTDYSTSQGSGRTTTLWRRTKSGE